MTVGQVLVQATESRSQPIPLSSPGVSSGTSRRMADEGGIPGLFKALFGPLDAGPRHPQPYRQPAPREAQPPFDWERMQWGDRMDRPPRTVDSSAQRRRR